jgi:transcriptional regulator with XRE-family HTH domain
VAFYRKRRGLAHAVLAGLVGRSEDRLSKVERGERDIRRLDVLTDVARALRVTLGDLLGQPVLMETDHSRDDDIPAIRDALMEPQRLSRKIFAQRRRTQWIPLDQAASLTESAWSDYQHGRIGRVVAVLPMLIRSALALEEHSTRLTRWKVSSRVHHLTATTLIRLGEEDLAWVAGERAMTAADQSDDPLVLVSAARAATHAPTICRRAERSGARLRRRSLEQVDVPDAGAVASLTGLQSLSFHPNRIDDGRVQPLGTLSDLEKLSIPTNLFTTEQIAWLRAHLPATVESNALPGIVTLSKPIERDGKSLDVLLVGKRKPFLNSETRRDANPQAPPSLCRHGLEVQG